MSINGNPAAECAARRILPEISSDPASHRLKEVADIIADECKDFYGPVEDYFCESCGGGVAERARVAHTADCKFYCDDCCPKCGEPCSD